MLRAFFTGEWSSHHEVQEMIKLQSQGAAVSFSDEDSVSDNESSSHDSESSSSPVITVNDTKFMALMNLSDSGD